MPENNEKIIPKIKSESPNPELKNIQNEITNFQIEIEKSKIDDAKEKILNNTDQKNNDIKIGINKTSENKIISPKKDQKIDENDIKKEIEYKLVILPDPNKLITSTDKKTTKENPKRTPQKSKATLTPKKTSRRRKNNSNSKPLYRQRSSYHTEFQTLTPLSRLANYYLTMTPPYLLGFFQQSHPKSYRRKDSFKGLQELIFADFREKRTRIKPEKKGWVELALRLRETERDGFLGQNLLSAKGFQYFGEERVDYTKVFCFLPMIRMIQAVKNPKKADYGNQNIFFIFYFKV